MTYQKPTPNYDNADADESSSLFLTVADASPSSSLGHDGVATKKNGVLMVAVIATCFLLGTIYSPLSSSSSSSNNNRAVALLQDQIEIVYDRNNDKNDSAMSIAEICGQELVTNSGACSMFIEDDPNPNPAECVDACILLLGDIVNKMPDKCLADCFALISFNFQTNIVCNTFCSLAS